MTRRPRRQAVLRAAAALAAWGRSAGVGMAAVTAVDGLPLRSRLLIAYPAGGVSDWIARELAARLAAQGGHRVVIENRPGASGLLAMRILQRGPADGSLLCFAAVTAVSLLLPPGAPPPRELPVLPVAGVMRTPVLVVGTSALAARGVGSLEQALAQARAGLALRWATTGEGTTGHAVLDRIRRATGAAIVHVPYKGGGQQLNDALGGFFEILSTNAGPRQLEAIADGRLLALGVGAPQRLPVLPGTPTLGELGFEPANLDSLFGLFAPTGIQARQVQAWHRAIARALEDPTLRAGLVNSGNTPFEGSVSAFADAVRGRLIRGASGRL